MFMSSCNLGLFGLRLHPSDRPVSLPLMKLAEKRNAPMSRNFESCLCPEAPEYIGPRSHLRADSQCNKVRQAETKR